MSIDTRDVRVTVTLAEEEARFLAGLVAGALGGGAVLTIQQVEIAQRIGGKFLLAGCAALDALTDEHGRDAVSDVAERCMAAYPDVEEVSFS